MVVAVTVFLLEGTHESAIRGTFDGFDVDALPLRGLLTRALSPADAEPGDGISGGRTADSNAVADVHGRAVGCEDDDDDDDDDDEDDEAKTDEEEATDNVEVGTRGAKAAPRAKTRFCATSCSSARLGRASVIKRSSVCNDHP